MKAQYLNRIVLHIYPTSFTSMTRLFGGADYHYLARVIYDLLTDYNLYSVIDPCLFIFE